MRANSFLWQLRGKEGSKESFFESWEEKQGSESKVVRERFFREGSDFERKKLGWESKGRRFFLVGGFGQKTGSNLREGTWS